MKKKLFPGQKIICLNRKASFNYFFKEILEAGIALKGSEVKSLRDGKGSIADSYAIDKNGEIFLINSHIPLYRQSSYNNHNPKRERKLLLKKEINKLIGRINQEGLTIVPKMYFLKGKVKVEIAVAKGKKLYDKRQVKKQEIGREKKQNYLAKITNDTFKYWFKFKFKTWNKIQNISIAVKLLIRLEN